MAIRYSKKYYLPHNYSLANAILDILWATADSIKPGSTPYQEFREFRRRTMGFVDQAEWRINRALAYLKERNRIQTMKRGDKLFIKLTKKGRLDALMQKILKSDLAKKKWDGKWRLILWDIPESSRIQRDRLRRFCKALGFYQLQKSVFIRPSPLPSSAVEYLIENDLVSFIRFLRVDQMDQEKMLLKHFALKRHIK